MTATAHALVAGALATKFGDPITVTVLALTSHYVMDSIPHWDFGTNWRSRPKRLTGALAIGETVVGISLSYMWFGTHAPLMNWGLAVFASVLPDWLETPWYIFFAHHKKVSPDSRAGIFEQIAYAFYKIPNVFHSKAQLPLGLLTQIITVGFFLTLLA